MAMDRVEAGRLAWTTGGRAEWLGPRGLGRMTCYGGLGRLAWTTGVGPNGLDYGGLGRLAWTTGGRADWPWTWTTGGRADWPGQLVVGPTGLDQEGSGRLAWNTKGSGRMATDLLKIE